jgi:hypothetical protein
MESPREAMESGTGVAAADAGTVTAVVAGMRNAMRPINSDRRIRLGVIGLPLPEGTKWPYPRSRLQNRPLRRSAQISGRDV